MRYRQELLTKGAQAQIAQDDPFLIATGSSMVGSIDLDGLYDPGLLLAGVSEVERLTLLELPYYT